MAREGIRNFAHGKHQEVRALFELAREPKQFLELRGDHNDGMFSTGRQYTDAVRKFIEGTKKP